MRTSIALAILLAVSTSLQAAAPGTAQNFLDRANRLKAKGPFALVDKDYGRLKAEANAAGKSIGDDRIAAQKAGRQILYCSPKPRADLGQTEFLNGLAAIPAVERSRISLKSAMLRILQKKYPCPR